MIRFALLVLLVLSGCDGFPRDTDGTLDRVTTSKRFTVGFEPGDRAARAFIATVATMTGAVPVYVEGSGEELMLAVEAGEVDLLMVPLDPASPWATRVTIGPPLAEPGGRARLVPVTRNGENAWVDRVHRAARQR